MKFHANHEGFLKFYASAVGAEEDEDDDDDDDDDNDLAQIQNSDSVSQEENGIEEPEVKIERRRKKTKQGGASLEKEDSFEDSSEEDIGFKSSGIGDTVADSDEDELAQIQAANK